MAQAFAMNKVNLFCRRWETFQTVCLDKHEDLGIRCSFAKGSKNTRGTPAFNASDETFLADTWLLDERHDFVNNQPDKVTIGITCHHILLVHMLSLLIFSNMSMHRHITKSFLTCLEWKGVLYPRLHSWWCSPEAKSDIIGPTLTHDGESLLRTINLFNKHDAATCIKFTFQLFLP